MATGSSGRDAAPAPSGRPGMMGRMTKRFTHQLTYDAPLPRVARMLTDPSFREEVCDAQRVSRREVEVTGEGPRVVRLSYAHPTDRAPSFAKKLVGDAIEVVQTETWLRDDHATIDIEMPGKPGEAKGNIRLEEKDGKTVQTVDLSVRVGVPLVGGKLEQAVGLSR